MSNEIKITKEDFNFIDIVFKKYNIVEGKGYKNIALIILNELRISENIWNEKYSEYCGLDGCEEQFEERFEGFLKYPIMIENNQIKEFKKALKEVDEELNN